MNEKILMLLLVAVIVFLVFYKPGKIEAFTMQFLDIPGYDLESQKVNNESECVQACEKDPKCLFYNYEDESKSCWTKQGKPNPNMEVGLNGNKLLHGDNTDLDFNVLSTAPANSSAECANLSAAKGHNVWKYAKDSKQCMSGRLGVAKSNISTGSSAIPITTSCPPPPTCPTCAPPTVCPTCPTCPPQQQCPSCPPAPTCQKCWLPALF